MAPIVSAIQQGRTVLPADILSTFRSQHYYGLLIGQKPATIFPSRQQKPSAAYSFGPRRQLHAGVGWGILKAALVAE